MTIKWYYQGDLFAAQRVPYLNFGGSYTKYTCDKTI